MESEKAHHWTEKDSTSFLDLGRFIVPERDQQLAVFCDLVPAAEPGSNVVEIGCGEGLLASALLERFPEATVHGYDGSPAMLESASHVLSRFGGRFKTRQFDLAAHDWRVFPYPVKAVVSSLVLHHLDGVGKRELFRDLSPAIAPGGALVIADIVRAASRPGEELAARTWDAVVRRQALALSGGLDPWNRFRREGWNYFVDPDADPIDHPSTLLEQLQWLGEAGFIEVDVHWFKAGHALFGGRKPA